jgi:hypothetical protein
MKSSLIFLFLLFFVIKVQAQFTITHNTETYSNGVILTTNSLTAPDNEIGFYLNNTSEEIIKYKIASTQLVNNNGSTMQVCIGVACYPPGVTLGEVFPPSSPVSVEPSENSYIHLISSNAGTGSFPVDFVFKIYLLDDNNVETGTPFYFTYRYDPNAISIADTFAQSTSVFPTYSSDFIHVQAQERVQSSVFDLQGRMLLSHSFQSNPIIDLSSLANQVYILVVENEKGEKFTQKVFKI